MSVCDPEKIVDREKELALVSEKVSRLARGEPFAPHERVIHLWVHQVLEKVVCLRNATQFSALI